MDENILKSIKTYKKFIEKVNYLLYKKAEKVNEDIEDDIQDYCQTVFINENPVCIDVDEEKDYILVRNGRYSICFAYPTKLTVVSNYDDFMLIASPLDGINLFTNVEEISTKFKRLIVEEEV